MVILKGQNKITDFLMIFAWASPFNLIFLLTNVHKIQRAGDKGQQRPTYAPLATD